MKSKWSHADVYNFKKVLNWFGIAGEGKIRKIDNSGKIYTPYLLPFRVTFWNCSKMISIALINCSVIYRDDLK